jgi:hypothetical protein
MKKPFKAYFALVTWEDAYYKREMGLDEESALTAHEPLLVEMSGWVVRLDSKVCLLSNWKGANSHYRAEYRDFHAIPRGMIRGIQRIYKGKK